MSFLQTNGFCKYGTIVKADTKNITIKLSVDGTLNLPLSDITAIFESIRPRDLIYTTRSSWYAVQNAMPGLHEFFRVTIQNGKVYKGKPAKITADSIELESRSISKSEIKYVDYIRQKPTTDGMQYLGQEAPFLLFFDPEFYYRASGLPGRISVRLYDSAKPEDDSPLTCKK
jgi:hypothetical protein